MDFADGFRFWSFDVFHKKLLALTGALLALTLLSAQPVPIEQPHRATRQAERLSDGAAVFQDDGFVVAVI